jgi:prolipoprotein diacylglyceryltransferase
VIFRRAGDPGLDPGERPARQLLEVRNDRFVVDNGFYLAVGCYGAQRFVWEFFKPYGALIGPLTLFHLLSAAIVAYAVVMIATAPTPKPTREDEQDDRAFA